MQAIEDEQIGKPMKESSSELLRRRFAVKEAGFSLVASLLPAIEAVEYATIVPYDGFPTGRTVLERHRDRVESDVYTKRYLTEQLLLVLAGDNQAFPLLSSPLLSSPGPCSDAHVVPAHSTASACMYTRTHTSHPAGPASCPTA